MKYLVKARRSSGYFHIISKTVGLNDAGLIPKFRGGCMAIIPRVYKNSFVLFKKADYYYEDCILTRQNLLNLARSYRRLTDKVFIDNTEMLFETKFKQGSFIVTINKREKHRSLVTIEGNGFYDRFDISHSKKRLNCCTKALNARRP